MIIRLEMDSEKPIYQQLVEQIIEGIASGEILPGESLPSVRAMAADIGINLHTVNKAYQQLKQKGIIQINRRKGVLVNPDGIQKADAAFLEMLETDLRPIAAEAMLRDVSAEDFAAMCQTLYGKIKEGKK